MSIDLIKSLLINPTPEQREAAACVAVVHLGLDAVDAWNLIGTVSQEMSETSEREVIRLADEPGETDE